MRGSFVPLIALLSCVSTKQDSRPTCAGEPRTTEAVCVGAVRARIVDEADQPVSDMEITVCGDVCTYGRTGADGRAVVEVRTFVVKPAIGVHGKSRTTSYYARLGDEAGDVDVGTLRVHRWPEASAALPDADAGGTVLVGPLEIHVEKASRLFVDFSLREGGAERLRARAVPILEAPAFVRAIDGLVMVVALAPFGTRIDPRAQLAVRNDAGLAPGTAVEVFVHTTDPLETDGPWAGFVAVARAHVTSDGSWVRTDDGAGVPELSWVGVRPASR